MVGFLTRCAYSVCQQVIVNEFTAATRNVINHVMGFYSERADTPVCPYRIDQQAVAGGARTEGRVSLHEGSFL